MNINIKVKPGAKLPEYATEGSSGFDLVANSFIRYYPQGRKEPLEGDVLTFVNFKEGETDPDKATPRTELRLLHGERILIGTGIKVEIPSGFEMQVRPRSGMALKQGLTVINTPGTVDSDYRGEVGVIIINNGVYDTNIKLGDKIAQGVICAVERANWQVINVVTETSRGEGGYGSTDTAKEEEAKPEGFGFGNSSSRLES